ncbi:MAG: DUF1552 domain-containing protein [Myxococcota bacterium]|nr:DUF1552 domain-containing protein [Myxococcota bacterium]
MNRRKFIQATGLAASTLFLPSLHGRYARAQGVPAPPKRLIVFFSQLGTWHPDWKIHPANKPTDAFWELSLSGMAEAEFSKALKPLYPYRRKTVMIDGLAMVSAEVDQTDARHAKGQVHALTGANISLVDGTVLGSAKSIDQRIAEAIADFNRWKSLEIGVGTETFNIAFSGDKQTLPFEMNPANLYRRLFVNSGLTADEPASISLSGRGRILDRLKTQYARLTGRLSSEDARKLQVHQNLIETIEQRISNLANLTCANPPVLLDDFETYQAQYQAYVPMITAAFSCDMTRVISIQMGELSKMEVLGTPGDLHDEHSHAVFTNPESAAIMTKYTAVHAQHVAELLSALDAVPEGNGTLLDNTLVAWVGELGDGSHGYDRWAAMLFGGGGGFSTGRLLHYPRKTPIVGRSAVSPDVDHLLPSYETMGVPHQKFLTSVCQAMGLQTDRMPVETLRGKNGETVDCTGPLTELFA